MTATIIDGKKIAEKIEDEVAKEIFDLGGPRPNLAIVLVGDRPDSELYVSLKEKEAKKVGIDTHLYRSAADIPEPDLFEAVRFLSLDESIDAILVQLPLPEGFDTDGLILLIDPAKDVDCFHPDNLVKLFASCDHEAFIPPVFQAVLAVLAEVQIDTKGKKAVIVANSDRFGKSLAKVLACRGCETQMVRPDDAALAAKTNTADILITAVGRAHFITAEYVKPGATVIDIGITREEGEVLGDVEPISVCARAAYLTPVPGGIGPITIATLFKNTLALFKRRRGE